MEALATLNNQRQFDFQNNGIEVIGTLKHYSVPTRRTTSTAIR